jgi:polyferredoxin/ferredoxin
MSIRTVRRICQIFFLLVFLWFCVVTTLGDRWWQLRGWPVNWLLQLDPLVGLGTLLTTRTLYAGLAWGLATIALTIVLGRFFCGWVCPFGTLHQALGYLGHRHKPPARRADTNRYRPHQSVKYLILTYLLAVAAAELLGELIRLPATAPWWFAALAAALAAAAVAGGTARRPPVRLLVFTAVVAVWVAAGFLTDGRPLLPASLQIGWLDPLPLVHRSVNLVLLPLLDQTTAALSPTARYYQGAGLIGTVFAAALLLNLKEPRFYCRYICPLGALFGIMGRHALWRIGKTEAKCTDCRICETNCEGACSPASVMRTCECVLCLNCLKDCRHGLIGYRTAPSAAGEIALPELGRRRFVVAAVTGFLSVPVLRLGGRLAANGNPDLVRPPGALAEGRFLERCIKCGQCMRICPTNVIQPAGLEGGLEGWWTPVLNFRIGTSGCQYKCVACGHVCPTAAIRPMALDERLGRERFAVAGPVRIGTAFVDRGRCLPWAMNTPCIVCQENCPVSPKAIVTGEVFEPVLESRPLVVESADARQISLTAADMPPGRYGTGDYYCRAPDPPGGPLRRIVANTDRAIVMAPEPPWAVVPAAGSRIEVRIRLQQPHVQPHRCIGCGVCEHECPVRGRRAIRVTAENESRNPANRMLLRD